MVPWPGGRFFQNEQFHKSYQEDMVSQCISSTIRKPHIHIVLLPHMRVGMKQVLWWLIAGSKGGINRARIIRLLHERPYNANQITQLLHLDYKTIRHHLEVMKKHQVITPMEEGYGTMYFLTEQMEAKYGEFMEIWRQIESVNDKGVN